MSTKTCKFHCIVDNNNQNTEDYQSRNIINTKKDSVNKLTFLETDIDINYMATLS